jgi:hypothetical protein
MFTVISSAVRPEFWRTSFMMSSAMLIAVSTDFSLTQTSRPGLRGTGDDVGLASGSPWSARPLGEVSPRVALSMTACFKTLEDYVEPASASACRKAWPPTEAAQCGPVFSVVTVDALEGPYFRTVTTFEGVRCASNDLSQRCCAMATVRFVGGILQADPTCQADGKCERT